jgi:beta-glucanase (GH16 family)
MKKNYRISLALILLMIWINGFSQTTLKQFESQLPQAKSWKLVWNDEFNGSTLDTSRAGVEMDIMENFTRDNKISQNIHWNGYGTDHKQKGSGSLQIEDTSKEFHTFGLYWSKSGYIFYVDGKVSWSVDGPVSDVEQFILISTECMGYRNGNRNQPSEILKKAVLPDAFIVDYVRVFDEVVSK